MTVKKPFVCCIQILMSFSFHRSLWTCSELIYSFLPFNFLYLKLAPNWYWYRYLIFFVDQNTTAFKEVAIIRHPRIGEYAFGFITSTVILQVLLVKVTQSLCICFKTFLGTDYICILSTQRESEDEELCSVFVPTNHLYIGDIFLVNSKEIIRPNLSIREGIGQWLTYYLFASYFANYCINTFLVCLY